MQCVGQAAQLSRSCIPDEQLQHTYQTRPPSPLTLRRLLVLGTGTSLFNCSLFWYQLRTQSCPNNMTQHYSTFKKSE